MLANAKELCNNMQLYAGILKFYVHFGLKISSVLSHLGLNSVLAKWFLEVWRACKLNNTNHTIVVPGKPCSLCTKKWH